MSKKLLCAICFVISSSFHHPLFAGHNHNKSHVHQACHGYQSKIKQFESVMDQYITQQIEAHNDCGLSVVVVDNNRIIYQKGFGFADKENNIAVTDSSLFHIGSITKLFTGMGIMELAQKGLINIDALI